jgi:hypothetical protein
VNIEPPFEAASTRGEPTGTEPRRAGWVHRTVWRAVPLPLVCAVLCVAGPWLWWSRQLSPPQPDGAINFFNYDQYSYTMPAFRYAAPYLRHGRVPLWAPQQLSGSPFLAGQLHGILYPAHWLMAWMPLPELWRLLIFLHGAVAMGGAYLCARVFGASRSAALFGGATYAFAAPVTVMVVSSMEPALVSAAWLPWQLGLARATLVAPQRWMRWACGLGLSCGLVVLGGHLPYLPIAVTVCGTYIACHLAVLWWRSGTSPVLRRAARLLLAGVIAIGISAAQLFPTAELSQRSQRVGAFRSAAHAAFGADLRSPSLLVSSLFNPLPTTLGWSDELFLGTLAGILALLALTDRAFRRRAAFLWVLAVLTFLLSLGTRTPLFQWYFRLQGGAFRIPQRFIVATAMLLALLSALGCEAFRRTPRARLIFSGLCGLGALVLWLLVHGVQTHAWLGAYIRSAGFAASYPILLRVGVGALPLVALPRTLTRRWVAPVFLLVLGAVAGNELHNSCQLHFPILATHPDALPVPVDAAAFIRQRAGFARVATPILSSTNLADMGRQVPVRIGLLEDLYAISDYEPIVDRRYAELLWPMSGMWGLPGNAHLGPVVREVTPAIVPLLRVLGVGYVLVPLHPGPAVRSLPQVFWDGIYAVYAIENPLPRVYVASAVQVAATPRAAREVVLKHPDWLLGGGAVVEDGDSLQGSTGTAAIRRYEDELVEVEATLSAPGLLVLGDAFDPFWVASVDGTQQPLLRTNYAFRGVRVGAGQHLVRFAYRPWPFYLGAGLSLLTAVALVLGGLATVWRRIRR